MPLKLMYITNNPEIALIAEENGVDRIFVDMEWIGKEKRQHHIDSVKNHHTIEDVRRMRSVLTKAQLLVRINPIHGAGEENGIAYGTSEEEIEETIAAGADIIMLPYYKTIPEVQRFLACVNGRCRTMLLLETVEAANILEATLQMEGIDEIHIGLNDLTISSHKKFLFQPLADGTVEAICHKLKDAHIPYGIGGIASLGKGLVPAEMIIKEHYRLGSEAAILSRSFCSITEIYDKNAVDQLFYRGVREIRTLEKECAFHANYFNDNQKELEEAVMAVVKTRDESN